MLMLLFQGLEFRLDNEEEGPVPKPSSGQHAVLGIEVSFHHHHPRDHHHYCHPHDHGHHHHRHPHDITT